MAGQKVVVNLASGLEDPERAIVAFLIAGDALDQGKQVAMFLTKEAVRLATPRVVVGVASGRGRLRSMKPGVWVPRTRIRVLSSGSAFRRPIWSLVAWVVSDKAKAVSAWSLCGCGGSVAGSGSLAWIPGAAAAAGAGGVVVAVGGGEGDPDSAPASPASGVGGAGWTSAAADG
jgi:hypothetical protein